MRAIWAVWATTLGLGGCDAPRPPQDPMAPGATQGPGSTSDGPTAGSSATGDQTSGSSTDGSGGGPGSGGSDGVDDTSGGGDGPGDPPPGGDTDEPFPIDRGDDPGTPGTYKGLPLRLVDNGSPVVTAVDGVIGVVCIGMSNGTQECSDFIDKLDSGVLSGVSGQVEVVDCAVSGHAIEKWADPAFDGVLWSGCMNRLAQAGVTPQQVRVVWHKAADQFTATEDMMDALPPYPDPDSDYFNFIDNLGAFAAKLPQMLPSVQAVYTTSRSYGGYASHPARGEPLSYEEGHALNTWLADNPRVGGVWHGWGPYIWAPDCDQGINNGSGVCYVREDYQDDGVHPAAGALDQISAMLHARLMTEVWYAQ